MLFKPNALAHPKSPTLATQRPASVSAIGPSRTSGKAEYQITPTALTVPRRRRACSVTVPVALHKGRRRGTNSEQRPTPADIRWSVPPRRQSSSEPLTRDGAMSCFLEGTKRSRANASVSFVSLSAVMAPGILEPAPQPLPGQILSSAHRSCAPASVRCTL